jgi:hypothetical protein
MLYFLPGVLVGVIIAILREWRHRRKRRYVIVYLESPGSASMYVFASKEEAISYARANQLGAFFIYQVYDKESFQIAGQIG